MRAHQFLLEYRRDLTAQALGNRLIRALASSRTPDLPDQLVGAQTLAGMALYPDAYFKKRIRMDVLGQLVTIDPATVQAQLQQLQPRIVATLLEIIESHDHSSNKQYVPWLARSWANALGKTRLEDLNRNNLLALFDEAKRRRLLRPEHTDVNRFQTWQDFENVMLDDYDLPTKLFRPEAGDARGQARKVYSDSTVRVIHPLDEQAACYYGRGTRWCTAATQSDNYFDEYNSDGPMYIFLPQQPQYPGEKYQISFARSMYMNERDEEIVPMELFQRFPGALEWFKKNVPEINYLIMFADDELITGIWNKIIDAAQELALDQITEWEQEDDGYWEYQIDFAEQRGYVTADGDIDWDRLQSDPKFQDYLEYNDDVRKIYQELQNMRNISANELKQMAEHYAAEEGEDLQIPGLENLFIQINHQNKDPFEINDDIARNFKIVPKHQIPRDEKRGKLVKEFQPYAEVGDYAIGWMRYKK
jgi:hypothetical protein